MQRALRVEGLDLLYLEQFGESRQQAAAGVEFLRRAFAGAAHLAARKSRHPDRASTVRRRGAADTEQRQKIRDTQRALARRQLGDHVVATLLPVAEILHPGNDASGLRKPESVAAPLLRL